MHLRAVRQLWGIEEPRAVSLPKIKANGYFAVETPIYFLNKEEQIEFKQLLLNNDLQFICQIHTDYYDKPRDKTVAGHIAQFRQQLADAKAFGCIFVNSHSGYDGWDERERTEFFGAALAIEQEMGVMVLHETHRRRVLYNPFVTLELCRKFPSLKLTADFSHWFCVLSNMLDDHMDIVNEIAPHVRHIHGRVGYDNGPQVPDPRAPEWLPWVEAHERCWDVVWEHQKKLGLQTTYFEPEYGPPTYCQTIPYTNKPVADIWEVSEWQTQRAVQRFQKMFSS